MGKSKNDKRIPPSVQRSKPRGTKETPINKDDLPENQPGHPNFNHLYGLSLDERASLKKERKAAHKASDARMSKITAKSRESKRVKQQLGDW